MKAWPALQRLAAAAAALSLAGCIGGPMAALPALDAHGNARQAANGDSPAAIKIPDGNGNGGESEALRAQADVQLALAPAPGPAASAKPGAGLPPICGWLGAGGNAQGLVDSQGRRFKIECFRADATGPAPAVLILHGLHGIGRSTIYARLAEGLNRRGIHAFVFQYLTPEPTLDGAAPAKAAPAKAAPAKAAAKPAPRTPGVDSVAQARAISDAITAVQALGYVDRERIGVFGLSLGGGHALALASRDARIGAVVDMFGAMPRAVAPEVVRMPPVLILHGDRDAIVPVRRAQELDRLLKKIGAPHETKIYKGQGHSFRGAADADSLERSVEFFHKWLKSPAAAAGPG
jgi:dienelactone hydrolase